MGNLSKALKNLAEDYQMAIMRQISAEKLNASGSLRKSIEYKVTDKGFTIESDKEYAFLLGEDGASPTKKNSGGKKLDNIRDWIKAKGIRPLTKLKSGGYKFKGKRIKNKNSAMNSLVYIMNKTISEKGTIKRYGYKGSGILQKVNDRMKSKGFDVITEAYKLDLINGMKQEFKFDNIKVE